MTTLQNALDEFILGCQADGLSRSTTDWYQSLLRRFVVAHPDRLLSDIAAHDMREYVIGLRKHYSSPDTISDHIRALHRFWKWSSQEYQVGNPMRSVKYPKLPERKPRAAEMEDISAMFKAATEPRDRAILAFMLDTGCRAAGVVRLQPNDVDLNDHRALVTEKGEKTRGVVFTAFTADLLSAWIAQRHPAAQLFYNLDTLEPLTRNGLYQLFRRLARRAGVKGRFNPHALRHTFAREYIRAGGDLATLSKLLGHRDVGTTVAHYAIFTDGEIAEKHEKYSPVRRLKNEE
jgi:integrase/recombinase XerD